MPLWISISVPQLQMGEMEWKGPHFDFIPVLELMSQAWVDWGFQLGALLQGYIGRVARINWLKFKTGMHPVLRQQTSFKGSSTSTSYWQIKFVKNTNYVLFHITFLYFYFNSFSSLGRKTTWLQMIAWLALYVTLQKFAQNVVNTRTFCR